MNKSSLRYREVYMKHISYIIVVLVGLLFFASCGSGTPYDGPLFPILTMAEKKKAESGMGFVPEELARWGFMTETGKIVIKPKYHFATPFQEGFATVQILDRKSSGVLLQFDSRWGAINRSGKLAIPDQYKLLDSFSEGLAKAVLLEKKRRAGNPVSGYIDGSGEFAFSWDLTGDNYYFAGPFSEGLAYVPVYSAEDAARKSDDEAEDDSPFAGFFSKSTPPGIILGYVDVEGTLIIPAQFKAAGDFHEGLAYVMDAESELFGYIDTTGQMVIEPRFDNAKDFSYGLAGVSLDGVYGFIDKRGNFVIEPIFGEASAFTEGLAPAQIDGKFGFIDKTGDFLIKPAYDYVGRFSEGIAAVGRAEENAITWAFIDKNGSEILPYKYSNWVDPAFKNGLALVQQTEMSASGGALYSSGYINTAGEWIYKPVAGPWYYFIE